MGTCACGKSRYVIFFFFFFQLGLICLCNMILLIRTFWRAGLKSRKFCYTHVHVRILKFYLSESSLGAQSFCWFCHEVAHYREYLIIAHWLYQTRGLVAISVIQVKSTPDVSGILRFARPGNRYSSFSMDRYRAYSHLWSIGESPSICPFLKKIMDTRPWRGRLPLFFRNGQIRGLSPT